MHIYYASLNFPFLYQMLLNTLECEFLQNKSYELKSYLKVHTLQARNRIN
jgi:hypothetical protein